MTPALKGFTTCLFFGVVFLLIDEPYACLTVFGLGALACLAFGSYER